MALTRHNTLIPLLLVLSSLAVLPGCSVLGDMKPAKFTCGLPNGVGCKPVSDVYKLSTAGRLKDSKAATSANSTTGGGITFATSTTDADDVLGIGGNKASSHPATLRASARVPAGGNSGVLETVAPGNPILTRPRQIRIWVDRWEDKDGDLHDETYLYLRLDSGRWLLQ